MLSKNEKSDARVTDSMMPEGVEHNVLIVVSTTASFVTDSMMPEGVEHPYPTGVLMVLLKSDRFHDAGRR